jgi:hypothetical protein
MARNFGLPIVVAENNRKQLSEKAKITHIRVKTSGEQLVAISCSIPKPIYARIPFDCHIVRICTVPITVLRSEREWAISIVVFSAVVAETPLLSEQLAGVYYCPFHNTNCIRKPKISNEQRNRINSGYVPLGISTSRVLI